MVVDEKLPGAYSLLITDDDHECLNTLRGTFPEPRFKTHLAHNGTEAIEVARHERVDGVIVDMQMPDLTGLETIAIITREVGRELPFVVISAETSKELMLQAMSAHAYCLVPKPFNIQFLRELVAQMLRKFYETCE